jgi:hypothetical protein
MNEMTKLTPEDTAEIERILETVCPEEDYEWSDECERDKKRFRSALTEYALSKKREMEDAARELFTVADKIAEYEAAVEDFLEIWPLRDCELQAYCAATFVPALRKAASEERPSMSLTLELRNKYNALESENAKLKARVEELEANATLSEHVAASGNKFSNDLVDRIAALETRLKVAKSGLTKIEKMPWENSQSPYAVIARTALAEIDRLAQLSSKEKEQK